MLVLGGEGGYDGRVMRIMGQKWVAMVAVAVAVWAGMAGGAFGQVKALKAVAVKGVRYVALKDLAAMYKLKMGGQGAKGIVISGEYVKLEFQGDGRQATINGTSVWLHQPVAKVKGNWCICDADAQFTVDPLVRPSAYLGGRGTATVALDAGHGGKDPGALAANGTQEKMLSLDIARRVRSHLAVAGVKVVMTRDSDVFLELADRPKAASKAKADLFVSVHLNATAGTGVKGVETFAVAAAGHPPTAGGTAKSYPAVPNNAFNHSGTVLAYQIQKAVSGITRAEDRGVKRARFAVLRESVMPAALVECGFLTNPQEAARLQTPSYRETLAQGIAQGILNYLALVKRAKLGPGAAVAQVPAGGAPGAGVDEGRVVEEKGYNASRNKLQTVTLLDTLEKYKFDAALGGARRDEEKARAKERFFSHRDEFGQWDPKNQRPELWNIFNGKKNLGEHFRVFPISNWTEMDVWQYILQENIPLPSLYYTHERDVFERDGVWLAHYPFMQLKPNEKVVRKQVRCRTIGDITCTGLTLSSANKIEDIIDEIASSRVTERGGRADDKRSETAMEDRKKAGYF